MIDSRCHNPYLQTVWDVVARAEIVRAQQQKAAIQPRTIVKCVADRFRGEILEVTRYVYLHGPDDPPAPIKFELMVDGKVNFVAIYSGGAGFALSADDIERFHAQITKLSQSTPRTQHLYGWTVSIEPHGSYSEFPPPSPIPLYIFRKNPVNDVGSFGAEFLDAIGELDGALYWVYNLLLE